jgi:DNA-3-methyladenine glycosylase I
MAVVSNIKKDQKIRCKWANTDPEYLAYHDKEWGVPVYDDRLLFEYIILEGMQAGLNWLTILKKRENYRQCLNGFDAKKIAKYDKRKMDALLKNPGIIRNRLKIQSLITNANAFLKIVDEFGSFSDYIWQFTDGKPIQNHWKNHSQIPANTSLSDKISKDLKKRGFKFVGSTICYAFMQAVGMVNDHTTTCFRHKKLKHLKS